MPSHHPIRKFTKIKMHQRSPCVDYIMGRYKPLPNHGIQVFEFEWKYVEWTWLGVKLNSRIWMKNVCDYFASTLCIFLNSYFHLWYIFTIYIVWRMIIIYQYYVLRSVKFLNKFGHWMNIIAKRRRNRKDCKYWWKIFSLTCKLRPFTCFQVSILSTGTSVNVPKGPALLTLTRLIWVALKT